MKAIVIGICCLSLFWGIGKLQAQETPVQSPKILLNDIPVQIETMEAVNNLYNFKFEEADREFRWFKIKYPTHPMPYFLLGLAEWWKIMPDPDEEKYDERFLAYMDSSIVFGEKLYDSNPIEGAFFLAAAYGFKGRLYSERKSWAKAAIAGKNALKYLDKFKDKGELSIEFLFGDALYNYYREWIPEHYGVLKPILMFFERGDLKKGMEQLKQVSYNAFYTRTEAQYFLMRIYEEENQSFQAYQLARTLLDTYPDNPYFHRYCARMSYTVGRLDETEQLSLSILERIEKGTIGYEAISGRYASYFLGYLYHLGPKKDLQKAKSYYRKAIAFVEQSQDFDSGYYLASLGGMARIALAEQNTQEATEWYEKLRDAAPRKSASREEAERFFKEQKKARKKKKTNSKGL